jgi:ATP-dependent protease ClpP protease subunit
MSKLVKDEIERYFSSASVDTSNRIIYIGSGSYTEDGEESGVDGRLASNVIKALSVLDHLFVAEDKPITIQLNCVGGDYLHGMAIYDAICECKNHVTIKAYGNAHSMGSVIFQAGDERIISPNGRLMIHYGKFGMEDHSKNVINWAKEEERFHKL